MKIRTFFLKALRKIFHQRKIHLELTDIYTQYKNQEANDYIRNLLMDYFSSGKQNGLMFAKFGTIELGTFVCYEENKSKNFYSIIKSIRGYFNIDVYSQMDYLCNNSGFFPNDISLLERFADQFRKDAASIDVLASYCYNEKYLDSELKNSIRVNLDGYYAPFLWEKPWTSALTGKKVLVIHPFVDSIKKQYEKRALLFDDKTVLPEFKEINFIKAIQSIAGNKPEEFETWFDALEFMKQEINKVDFDVAIIGCGAYGMSLASYVKSLGKVGIHLAGWTQMLFGIYGSRWINDQPQYSKFINENWTRPMEIEKPKNCNIVEKGCYW